MPDAPPGTAPPPDSGPSCARPPGPARAGRPRVLDEPFARMMIFDRRVTITSSSADGTGAASVEDPAVVDHPVGALPRGWERAVRVPRFDDMGEGFPKGMRRMGESPAEGLTRKAVRRGLSERTAAGHLARPRERHDAGTPFQPDRPVQGGRRHG